MAVLQPIGTPADKVVAGDTVTVRWTVKDRSGALVDLSTYAITFVLSRAKTLTLADGSPILTKTVGSGITINSTGLFTVTLSASETTNLLGNFIYNVKLTDGSGNVTTIAYGPMEVQQSLS